jgi:hypothetical protein
LNAKEAHAQTETARVQATTNAIEDIRKKIVETISECQYYCRCELPFWMANHQDVIQTVKTWFETRGYKVMNCSPDGTRVVFEIEWKNP